MKADSPKEVKSARWLRVQDLYQQALACDHARRTAFLDDACSGDVDLRREVESLLGYASEADRFLEGAPTEEPHPDVMGAITEGRELGSYKILSVLGAGGMGKVYLARDTRLGRTVAIKILSSARLADAERKRRFMQEARTASSLNHPNIVTLYDIASDSGIDFLVMEYVEGQSLHQRITPRGLPLKEVIGYGTQIASALAAAHSAGIVHRDIKPANVMVTDKGVAKVLDFGLAKLAEPMSPDDPTDSTRTREGVIVGTASYMSPEQAAGKRVDTRSDIFAVGVVVYEMLTGRRAFDRGTVLATLGAVMYEEPAPLHEVAKNAPPELQRIVERCLRKDPDRRIQTAADLKVALEELHETSATVQVAAPSREKSHRPWLVWTGIAVTVLAAAALAIFLFTRPEPPPALGATVALTSLNGWEVTPNWSPSGDQLVFSNNANGNMDIFAMSAAGGPPTALTNTPYDEVSPHWDPSFKYLAFAADPGTGTKVYLKPAVGLGEERILAETDLPSQDNFAEALGVLGTNPWSHNSQYLLFARATESGGTAIWRINVTTKDKSQMTFPGPGDSDMNATFSFDGMWIAFDRFRQGKPGMWVVAAEGGEPELVTEEIYAFSLPTWSADSKRLLFISERAGFQNRNIWEIEVASKKLRQITSGAVWNMFPVVSPGGRLAYVSFGPHDVNLYSASGGQRITSGSGESFFPSFSHDGRKLVYQSDRTFNEEIYLLDLDTKAELNITDHPAMDLTPDWSPDGSQIVFLSNRQGPNQVWVMDSDGGSPRVLLTNTVPACDGGWGCAALAPRWSPDGKSIAFIATNSGETALWVANRDGGNPRLVLERVLYFDWYDDQRIIFLRRGENGLTQVRAVDLTSRAETILLPEAAIELDVSPDRTKLLYTHAVSHFGMNLWMLPLGPGPNGMPIPGGDPKRVTNGGSDWHVHKGAWSRNGKTIVYTQDSDQGNIFTIENYR